MLAESSEDKVIIEIIDDIQSFDKDTLGQFMAKHNAPIFYKYEFLLAAQQHQLLPLAECRYLIAWRGDQMVGFSQSYLMLEADPFGVINQTTGLPLEPDTPAWLSHIMQFYESNVVCAAEDDQARNAILVALSDLQGAQVKAEFAGLMNVIDERLMAKAEALGWHVNYMWDRYFLDFGEIHSIEQLLMFIPRAGRIEVRRQLRKFEAEQGCFKVYRAPFENIETVAQMVFATTEKYGTPQYYPPQVFTQFVRTLGEYALIFTVEKNDEILGAIVGFEESGIVHLWAGGMIYDKSEFSPYTMVFYNAYLYAIENRLERVEAGRTNKKIKERLGFKPKPLYSIIKSL